MASKGRYLQLFPSVVPLHKDRYRELLGMGDFGAALTIWPVRGENVRHSGGAKRPDRLQSTQRSHG